jgi:hypothetical protein
LTEDLPATNAISLTIASGPALPPIAESQHYFAQMCA